jgi:hypothetical protein
MKRISSDVLAVWLAVALGVASYFCLIRWADCPDWDRQCFIYGPQ